MLSRSHKPPTNFLELCKALETSWHLIFASPLHFRDGTDAWEVQSEEVQGGHGGSFCGG